MNIEHADTYTTTRNVSVDDDYNFCSYKTAVFIFFFMCLKHILTIKS